MSNKEIARLLRNVAASYAIKNDKKYYFQMIAYQKAADTIEDSPTEAKDLYKEGKLEELAGVGPSIRQHLGELFKDGKVAHFDTVMGDIPPAVFPLLDIPSFGPKKAYKLVEHFKFQNPDTVIADLKAAAEAGKVAPMPGFGKKSEDLILQVLSEYDAGVKKNVRMVLPFANELAEKIIAYMKKSPAVIDAYPLGSLRRKLPTIGDVDLAVSTKDPEASLEHFVAYPYTERILEKGPASSSILISGGKHIDLMVQPPERFGSLLQHFTGSKAHNIKLRELALKKGFSLSEYGIKHTNSEEARKEFSTEEKFYHFLGLSWIPPEIREDTGEIELAAKDQLPTLVELKDMKGDFHIHSSYPIEPSHDMGKNSMQDMLNRAKALGYDYLGFSEHNPSVSTHTQEQIISIMEKRKTKIEQLRKSNKDIRIFSLLEVDILASGKVALPDAAADMLDGMLVSIHSSFSMNKEDMTKRILSGLSHPKAKILSHPTGRKLNQRNGIDADWDVIFAFAAKNNKALEINSWPERLDLPDSLIRQAAKHGVKFFIDTDSHATAHMDLMQYGVSVARRGWLTKDDILNTFSYNKLAAWFEK
jgi:DNA polymerase (family 10)